jgi:ribose/xylose/arabinose/galactoside ABC-type transport system permease subunit
MNNKASVWLEKRSLKEIMIGFLAISQTTVILSGGGGIDISVGTMASMGALFSATIMQAGERSTLLALIVVAVMGLALGTVNGSMIAYPRIHPFIMSLAGVKVLIFRFWIYAIPGMLSSVFGVLLLGYVHTVFLDVGNQYMFPSVVASAIGGISLAGGSGSYIGTFGGALVYTFLLSFLVTVNMDESLRKALFGLILILLLVIYSRSTKSDQV